MKHKLPLVLNLIEESNIILNQVLELLDIHISNNTENWSFKCYHSDEKKIEYQGNIGRMISAYNVKRCEDASHVNWFIFTKPHYSL